MTLLEITNLRKYFYLQEGGFLSKQYDKIYAVDDVNLSIKENMIMGLVGESGCGKTTLGKCLLRFYDPTSGSMKFLEKEISEIPENQLRKNIQMVFQDPYSSLTPTLLIGDILREPLKIFKIVGKSDMNNKINDLLQSVGLPSDYRYRYPHELSGGEKQRISIARALAVNPKLIIADEPISSLDVSVKAKILNLIKDLQNEIGFSCLFISHELGVIRNICEQVAVMYLGKVVEIAPSDELFNHPKHPYTEALLSASPIPNPKSDRKRIILRGEVPAPINPPSGCRFHPRCPYAKPICSEKQPNYKDLGKAHGFACHFPL